MSDHEDKPPHPKEATVHVLHVAEVKRAEFKISEQATLQAIWTESYAKLEIAPDPRDGFQAVEGEGHKKTAVDLVPYLQLTLAQATTQNLVKTNHFEITAGTGGA